MMEATFVFNLDFQVTSQHLLLFLVRRKDHQRALSPGYRGESLEESGAVVFSF